MVNLNRPNRERPMPTVPVQLTPDQIAWLEEQKWSSRRSKAEIVRELIDRQIAIEQRTDELAEADPPDRGATIAATRQYLANAGIAPAELVS